MERLSSEIRTEAFRLGFAKVGFARIEELFTESGRLSEWLARGYQASMGWMERNFEKRADPRKILPEAKSIISVALNYYTPHKHHNSQETGKVSRYAWGDDYHDIVSEKLQQLLSFILQKDSSAIGKYYVDTGPVMEKVWAQRAGIGWIGKHSNLITQDYGSWVFLGEIILNLDLDYDEFATDHCGSCTLCIEACPTDAIAEPYVVDSSRCISYLTIEHRGEIAEKLAEKFDGWIYGCDICQDVCPWNQKFSQPTGEAQFEPRPINVEPSLEKVVAMTEEEFREAYRKSPMKRTKREGLVRNAQLAHNSNR